MKKLNNLAKQSAIVILIFLGGLTFQSCEQKAQKLSKENTEKTSVENKKPEYFSLRPEVEKAFGYTQAVKVGDIIKISGVVSMDDKGNPTDVGDLGQQMKNCYASLEKILKHYDCTFDDVIKEDIFTTNMPLFLENASFRNTIYSKQFPTGTWVGVKELAIPVFMIEIEMEVYKAE